MEPLVGAVDTSAVAGAASLTIEDVLHRRVQINALALPRDLDPIG